MSQEEQAMKLAEVGHRAESNTRRIEKLELQTDALHSLATSVELLVAEQQHQTEAMLDIKNDVAELDKKVVALEAKPGKRWDAVVDKVLLAVISTVILFILGKIGIG